MGEMEFEQRELVKAVNIAVHEMNQSTEELRLSTLGGRFQVRWDEGASSIGCADRRETRIGCIIQAPRYHNLHDFSNSRDKRLVQHNDESWSETSHLFFLPNHV
jgi:hypothetical protein